MTLKWCVLTGALMLAFVGATFKYKSVVANPPGVYTRWFDGTTQRVDTFYRDGKLKSTTVYGDDGKTVLIWAMVTDAGALVHSKVRHEDGKVEEKIYTVDGKTLLVQTIWVGDESYFLAKREFYDDGKLHTEVHMTEDGTVPTSRQIYNEDGTLQLYAHILTNADQEMDEYQNGKLIHRDIFKANADRVSEIFFEGTEIVQSSVTEIALTKERIIELFSKDSTLLYRRLEETDGTMTLELNAKGKITLRQTLQKGTITAVEEFSPGASTPKRKLEVDGSGHVDTVSIYRADGTLARVKHLKNGVVTSQDNYDSSGTKIVNTTQGGEPEQFDENLLTPITPPRQEE